MKIIYINDGTSSVFDSQVLALLKYYVDNSFFDEVILLFGYQSKEEIAWLKKKDISGISIFYFKSYPNYPFFNKALQRSLLTSIRKISSDFLNYFFHIRGATPSYHFKKIAPKLNVTTNQLLTDVRGASVPELKEYSNANPIFKYLKLINYKAAFNAHKNDAHISVVSDYLKEYINSSLPKLKGNVYVNSCLVNDDFRFDQAKRVNIRKELSLKDNDILLIFTSGGTANWQNNDMILKIADKGIKVLNLSKKVIKHKNIITKFVLYKEVPGYLAAADIAFIWRDESMVNKVASPVKVSEYMACGLPIIHNGTVELINQFTVHKKDALWIKDIDGLNTTNILKLTETANRKILSERGVNLFGLKKIAKSYQDIYFNKN